MPQHLVRVNECKWGSVLSQRGCEDYTSLQFTRCICFHHSPAQHQSDLTQSHFNQKWLTYYVMELLVWLSIKTLRTWKNICLFVLLASRLNTQPKFLSDFSSTEENCHKVWNTSWLVFENSPWLIFFCCFIFPVSHNWSFSCYWSPYFLCLFSLSLCRLRSDPTKEHFYTKSAISIWDCSSQVSILKAILCFLFVS